MLTTQQPLSSEEWLRQATRGVGQFVKGTVVFRARWFDLSSCFVAWVFGSEVPSTFAYARSPADPAFSQPLKAHIDNTICEGANEVTWWFCSEVFGADICFWVAGIDLSALPVTEAC